MKEFSIVLAKCISEKFHNNIAKFSVNVLLFQASFCQFHQPSLSRIQKRTTNKRMISVLHMYNMFIRDVFIQIRMHALLYLQSYYFFCACRTFVCLLSWDNTVILNSNMEEFPTTITQYHVSVIDNCFNNQSMYIITELPIIIQRFTHSVRFVSLMYIIFMLLLQCV